MLMQIPDIAPQLDSNRWCFVQTSDTYAADEIHRKGLCGRPVDEDSEMSLEDAPQLMCLDCVRMLETEQVRMGDVRLSTALFGASILRTFPRTASR